MRQATEFRQFEHETLGGMAAFIVKEERAELGRATAPIHHTDIDPAASRRGRAHALEARRTRMRSGA